MTHSYTVLDGVLAQIAVIGGSTTMPKKVPESGGERDASLRVSRQVRDSLKAAAAVMGRPLYDVTNEALAHYLSSLKLENPLAPFARATRTRTRR
ncbi:MAG: hypothetical protein M0Q70_11435 [Dokdonella sp.]|nr:hypothetical protein [Dokdonella sp.]